MLGAFLFRGDDVFKSLDVLSGGEKSRIALLQLLLSPVNLLVLDEPTNHLDLHSKDVLLTALRDFGGTVVFVSHDRGFIEQLATQVLHLEPGHAKYYPGDYKYYLEQMEKSVVPEALEGPQKGGGSLPLATAASASSTTPSAGSNAARNACSASSNGGPSTSSWTPLSWEEQKRLESERRKKEKALSNLEQQLSTLEAQKKQLEQKLADPQVYSNGEKAKSVQHEIEALTTQIEQVTEQWMELSE